MNQMLSNVCRLNICFTLANVVIFLSIYSFQSLPKPLCNMFISSGRFLFSTSLLHFTLREWIRFVYIVNWKFMSCIIDAFASLFLLLWSLLGCAVFIFVVYFFGNNNTEMNYHYCTGYNHTENLQNAVKLLESHGIGCSKTICAQNLVTLDPLGYFTCIALSLLVLVSFLTWIDNHKHRLKVIWKKWKHCKSSSRPESPANHVLSNKLDAQVKLFDLTGGNIISIICIALVCSLPHLFARAFAHANENNVNSGPGRVSVYVSQISLVFFFFNFFPAVIIVSNPKMMTSLTRYFKDSSIGGKIWSFFKKITRELSLGKANFEIASRQFRSIH